MSLSPVAIVILMGILYSTQLQISKAMERQYIDTYQIIRDRLKERKKLKAEGKLSEIKPIPKEQKKVFNLYVLALLMNNSVVAYVWIAGAQDAPSTYFTSVIGVGLIALLFYSKYVMKEPLSKIEVVGAIILVSGTIVIGIDSFYRENIDQGVISGSSMLIAIVIFLLIGSMLIIYAIKKGTPLIVGLCFGLFAGGCGSMEPVLKGVGLAQGGGGAGAVPQTGMGWFLFILSFGLATMAFVFTQWGFAKGAHANHLVPMYNSLFVILPQILYLILLPGYSWLWTTYVGVIAIVLGIVLMTAFKEQAAISPPPSEDPAK